MNINDRKQTGGFFYFKIQLVIVTGMDDWFGRRGPCWAWVSYAPMLVCCVIFEEICHLSGFFELMRAIFGLLSGELKLAKTWNVDDTMPTEPLEFNASNACFRRYSDA